MNFWLENETLRKANFHFLELQKTEKTILTVNKNRSEENKYIKLNSHENDCEI